MFSLSNSINRLVVFIEEPNDGRNQPASLSNESSDGCDFNADSPRQANSRVPEVVQFYFKTA
jgi:hypothetical protein